MSAKDAKSADAEWFSAEELAAARGDYLAEQEKEQPSPQARKLLCFVSDPGGPNSDYF